VFVENVSPMRAVPDVSSLLRRTRIVVSAGIVKYLIAGACSTVVVLRVVVVRVTRRRERVRRCAVAGMTVATKSARVMMKVMARRAVFVLMFKVSFMRGWHSSFANCSRTSTAFLVIAMSVPRLDAVTVSRNSRR
jgi:hypothetical protein